MVAALFVATCLLSVVSWYTTWQGMALYLSAWFSILASLGIQIALVMVAWLIGFTRAKRELLIAVYAITAVVSIAFSYVSLFTWFSVRERPALIQRQLYDRLSETSAKVEEVLSAAAAEGKRHVLALEELTVAERTHGRISLAQDADPFLASVREAVAREAQTYSTNYKEGAGEGVRYSAFDRYTAMARQSLAQIEEARDRMAAYRRQVRPDEPAERQLRAFHEAYDQIPWQEAERTLHAGHIARPDLPAYSENVDKTASGQEDLMVAFQELFTAPSGRHAFALALAAFIDVIVFLLAYASGPYFFGPPEQRWCLAGASLDATQSQYFVRGFLTKLRPGRQGMPRVDASALSPGEQQFCMLLAAKALAVADEEDGRPYYTLDASVHETLIESLAQHDFPLRASPQRSPA
jgi:hypothetical protein